MYVYQYLDSRSWDWSSRNDIRDRLNDLAALSFKYNARYIILLRGSELPYWFSQKQFKEYKLGMIYPPNTYLIILENNDLYLNKYPFYITKVNNSEDSLIPHLVKYWVNSSIDNLLIKNDSIYISFDRPYVIYLTFNLPRNIDRKNNFLIFSLLSNCTISPNIRSIEIYGYDGYNLESLWVRTDIQKNETIILEDIDLNDYLFITLKIDTRGDILLEEFSIVNLSSQTPYEFYIVGKKGVLENNLNATIMINTTLNELKRGIGTYDPLESKIFYLNVEDKSIFLAFALALTLIYLLLSFAEWIKRRDRYGSNVPSLNKPKDMPLNLIYIVILIPVIYDLIYYPKLLEKSWIGDAPIIFSTIMFIMILSIRKEHVVSLGNRIRFLSLIPLIYIFNQYLLEAYLPLIEYINEWTVYSYISIDNIVSCLILYSLILFILLEYYRDSKISLLGSFSPLIYLFLSFFVFYINLIHSPIERHLSILPFYNGISASYILDLMGIHTSLTQYTYGSLLQASSGLNHLDVFIGWPCSGLTGIFIYTSFMIVEFSYLRRKYEGIKQSTYMLFYLLGLLIIFILNIFRISLIVYLGLVYNLEVSEVFHSIGYEMIFLFFIILYIYLIEVSYRRISI